MDSNRENVFTSIGLGRTHWAPYASNPAHSRGRLLDEPGSPTRTPFQRDRDRIIHSNAFRRLKHKTQVFIYHEGDHFRTRLTHTIEVSQIARSIARALYLDEDLAEALALAHDLGHPPFGHAGEERLDECMKQAGGFEHNSQSYRIVTELERRYADFDGLNLTIETLEGIAKHNGPLIAEHGAEAPVKTANLAAMLADYPARDIFDLHTYASLEAQAAAIADDIAYNAHDMDDGLRDGLFTLEDIKDLPLVGPILETVQAKYPHLDASRTSHEIVRRMITEMVEVVIRTSSALLEREAIASVCDVANSPHTIVTFSPEMTLAVRSVKAFLFERMYRQDAILAVRRDAQNILSDLFERYLREPDQMGREGRLDDYQKTSNAFERLVCDYIAGMTDRFAVQEHRRLFDVTPDLSYGPR